MLENNTSIHSVLMSAAFINNLLSSDNCSKGAGTVEHDENKQNNEEVAGSSKRLK